MSSVVAADFDDRVTVTCDGTYAYLRQDTVPAHTTIDGITGTNDQVPVPAPGYRSRITPAAIPAAAPTTIDAAVGVAVNGVPIYDHPALHVLLERAERWLAVIGTYAANATD